MNALAFTLLLAASQKPLLTYVGRIGTESFLLAWGNRDVFGRDSRLHGEAMVEVDGRSLKTSRSWIEVNGLRPDTPYEYRLVLNGDTARGVVRTYPVTSDRLSFVVMGDYGTGGREQHALARALVDTVEKKASSDSPVRFVLTTGDNIYARLNLLLFKTRTGSKDSHWEKTFFVPYGGVLHAIPFYPTPGNHDGDESEDGEDLRAYLDNFFFPGAEGPARYYQFGFGGIADFFALDSTKNAREGKTYVFAPRGRQSAWLEETLRESKAAWKIPYFHHAPFTAGPRHDPSDRRLAHWLELFEGSRISVVFTGHEHNLQISRREPATGNICYVVTGAGGELRRGVPKKFTFRGRPAPGLLAAWAREIHFLLVEIEGTRMRISPINARGSFVTLEPGSSIALPFEITLSAF